MELEISDNILFDGEPNMLAVWVEKMRQLISMKNSGKHQREKLDKMLMNIVDIGHKDDEQNNNVQSIHHADACLTRYVLYRKDMLIKEQTVLNCLMQCQLLIVKHKDSLKTRPSSDSEAVTTYKLRIPFLKMMKPRLQIIIAGLSS